MKTFCLHPQVHLSSSSLLAATEALPSLSIRNRTSYLVRCGSARRTRLTSKSTPFGSGEEALEEICSCEWCLCKLGDGVGIGSGCREGDGIRSGRSFDGRVLRQRTVFMLSPSAREHSPLSLSPSLNSSRPPISAVLILIILGGSFYILSQVVSSMVGVNEFVYEYGY
ncbi:LOW QUALITY PROTEIN: hypothetical protein YC2023_002271 [Brassica napus]